MDKFIYFNPRLTAKLNAIYHYPLTLVSGGAGIGKSFAVQTFLSSSKAEVIWHASKAPDFAMFISEFQKNYAVLDDQIEATFQAREGENPIPANLAVEIAIAIKKSDLRGRRVYVLEYQEEAVPEDVLAFLYYLSSQLIRGFYVVLISRQSQRIAALEQADASANVIDESAFLVRPREIRTAFKRNGFSIWDEEANEVYLRTAGWIPALKQAYERLSQNGRDDVATMAETGELRYRFSDSALATAWEERFAENGDFWNAPELQEARRAVESMEREKGLIAVERARVKATRFSALWDACDYYSALLLALSGQCVKALDGLNRAFESRIREGAFQSAWRLLLAQLQVRVFVGDHWFSDERALLLHYANQWIYDGKGFTKTAAALVLLQAGEPRRAIALLTGEAPADAIDEAWRGYMLAAAYREIGFEDEAKRCLAEGMAAAEAGDFCLPALVFYDVAAALGKGKKARETAARMSMPPQWREKLAAWRRAMKKNNGGVAPNVRSQLTVRESEIAELASGKLTNKEIAAQLHISENTVKTTLKRVYQKLGISGRDELAH